MKLRHHPKDLLREVALEWARLHDCPETSEDFFMKAEEGYYDAIHTRYHPTRGNIRSKCIIRVATHENGWAVYNEMFTVDFKPLSFVQKNLLKSGHRYVAYEKKQEVGRIFIKKNGIVSSGSGKYMRYIGFQGNVHSFGNIPIKSFAKMISNRHNNEWLEPLIRGIDYIEGLGMELIRKCSSLQDFLNAINLTDHPVSHKWFEGMNLKLIVERMKQAALLHNPVAYLSTPIIATHSDSDNYQLLIDSFSMAEKLNEKFWFNPKKIREKHDELVLIQLEKDTTIHSIEVSPFWKKVYKDLFTDWELIEDGKRLKREGIQQSHCVDSYHYKISSGECMILSREWEGKRYTLELKRKMDKTIYVNQCQGFGNSSAPGHLVEDIDNRLKGYNVPEITNPVRSVKETIDVLF
jgi:hypothetical protein